MVVILLRNICILKARNLLTTYRINLYTVNFFHGVTYPGVTCTCMENILLYGVTLTCAVNLLPWLHINVYREYPFTPSHLKNLIPRFHINVYRESLSTASHQCVRRIFHRVVSTCVENYKSVFTNVLSIVLSR